jgi:hypothetical protein
MRRMALGAGQADSCRTRSSSLPTSVKDAVTRAAPGGITPVHLKCRVAL